ncbi:MAG: DEAD/DEAH box helicase, partial [Alphaproteobacteria bacterium]|nr:DEAD/DEAH box helicase [Alphaproteobacteria bacterium]
MPFPPSHPALDRALAARGYEEPTPVQRAVLEADGDPSDPLGRDLLVSAQTGSGKTVAFGLTMAASLLGEAKRFEAASTPLALIVAPTRELAMQISRELAWLYAGTGARIAHAVGGMDVRREQRALHDGAHIVVGTPGRLRDHLERGYLNLANLKVAVLDEADEMLDLGFREELEFILDATPEARRTLMFSATIAKGIALLARRYQRDAIRIDTTSHTEPHGDIEYRAIRVAPFDIERAVVNVLRYFEAPGALVFCATREAVRRLHASLRDRGFLAVGLSGELSQRERDEALQSLRDGRARVCVATDVAARGLDLPDLGIVIHADLPTNKAGLLHRSGRTGRAGRKGVSVLMVTHAKRRKVEQILQSANIDAVWQGPPSASEIRAADRERLLNDPSLAEAPTTEDLDLGRALLEKLSPEQIAAMLMRVHRARLPDPEEVSDDNRKREARAPSPREARDGAARAFDRPQRTPLDRPQRDPRPSRADASWFHLNLGRDRNADPKWLVPMICRLGQVTKQDIGAIRIFDRETRFEIIGEAVVSFTEAARATLEDDTRITPSSAPDASTGAPDALPSVAPRLRDPRPREQRDRRGPDTPPASGIADVTPAEQPAFDARSQSAVNIPVAAIAVEAERAPGASPGPGKPKRDAGQPERQKKDWSKKDRTTETFAPRRDKTGHEPRQDRKPRAEAAVAPGEKPRFPPRPRQRVRQREERNAVASTPATESPAPRPPRDPNKPAWAKPAKHAHGKPFRNRTDSVTGASKR